MEDTETGELSWTLYSDFYNLYIEDFDEFSKVKEQDMPKDFKEMEHIKESVFKAALGKILSESTAKDWGGELQTLQLPIYTTKGSVLEQRFY